MDTRRVMATTFGVVQDLRSEARASVAAVRTIGVEVARSALGLARAGALEALRALERMEARGRARMTGRN